MSSYVKPTVNPDTHEIEEAEWLDDYFGQHNYGVRFPSDGKVFRADEYKWVEDPATLVLNPYHQGGSKTIEQTIEGKRINIMEHDNGRKDVHIEVKSLDVDLSDPSNVAAKKVIEEQILPALANRKVLVTLIHKPTNEHLNYIAFLPKVRENALKFIAAREDQMLDHYCLVQNDNGQVTVTSL